MTDSIDVILERVEGLDREATRSTSKRWVLSMRRDGTAQVYSPSVGPCRVVKPIAETTVRCGEWITALRNDAPALAAEVRRLREHVGRMTTTHPIEEWHEDLGNVLWWKLPVDEPPYVGTPLDSDWPGYHTHWSELPNLRVNHD